MQLLIDHINKFVELTDEEIALLTNSVKHKRIKKRQFLLNIGDIERVESFIIKGCLKTYFIDDKGEEHIVQFGVENWWIGDMYSFLTNTPSIYNIEALEDSELLQVDQETLEMLYKRIPKLERYFRLLIQNAYIASTRRILGTMSKPAEERYTEFLQKYPDIEQRIPQYMVASYLGITPEFLSRIRRKFAGK
jgi:CRP-like cAMP-binding protein